MKYSKLVKWWHADVYIFQHCGLVHDHRIIIKRNNTTKNLMTKEFICERAHDKTRTEGEPKKQQPNRSQTWTKPNNESHGSGNWLTNLGF